MTTQKAVIYGGKGALGAALVSFFKARNWVKMLSCNTFINQFMHELNIRANDSNTGNGYNNMINKIWIRYYGYITRTVCQKLSAAIRCSISPVAGVMPEFLYFRVD